MLLAVCRVGPCARWASVCAAIEALRNPVFQSAHKHSDLPYPKLLPHPFCSPSSVVHFGILKAAKFHREITSLFFCKDICFHFPASLCLLSFFLKGVSLISILQSIIWPLLHVFPISIVSPNCLFIYAPILTLYSTSTIRVAPMEAALWLS